MADAPQPAGTPDAVEKVLAAHLQTWPGEEAAGVLAVRYPSHGPEVVAAYGPVDKTFQWASVTKLLVSLASLIGVEEGVVSPMDAAGPPGSTFSHLLSHASGLPFEGTTPLTAPGLRRIYSNTGIEMAATYLGTAAGMPTGEYLRTGVLEPLQMDRTVVDGSPAHGARGPLGDLLALGSEFLSPGLISTETLRNATAVAWPGLAGVVPGFGRYDPCDWGLGPEVRSHKSPHWTGTANSPATFGHFGQSGAFLWVDPVVNLALAVLSSEPAGPWVKQSWPALSDAILAAFGHEAKLQPEAAGD